MQLSSPLWLAVAVSVISSVAVPLVARADAAPIGGDSLTANRTELGAPPLSRAVWEVQPQAGAIVFEDGAGNTAGRAAVGLTSDLNTMSLVEPSYGDSFVGPQTGAIVAPLSGGAALLEIPVDLKVGYAFMPWLRLSVRGGANVVYRSAGNAVNLGPSSVSLGADPGWRGFFNAGGDAEIGLGRRAALLLRPDVTFGPDGNQLYTTTVGLEVGFG